tara:strand:+ start:247 stop:474 length:228 start_codon:yes stop_codon:yes gene_type:complete
MKNIFILFFLLGAITVTANVHNELTYEESYVSSTECEEDNLKGTFTGKTRINSVGNLLYQYRCPNGHKWYSKKRP